MNLSAEPLTRGVTCVDCAPHVDRVRARLEAEAEAEAEARYEAALMQQERAWFPNLSGEFDESESEGEAD